MLAAYRHFLYTEFVSVPKVSAFSQTIWSSKVSTTLGAALSEDGIRIAFQNFAVFFLNLDDGQGPKQEIVSVSVVKSPKVLSYNMHNIKVNLLKLEENK